MTRFAKITHFSLHREKCSIKIKMFPTRKDKGIYSFCTLIVEL